MPVVRPSTSATAMPANESWSVLPKRWSTCPSTGWRETSDIPRSPVSARSSQCTYCTSTGRSSPSCARTRSMSAPDAPTPAITSAGSPGIRWMRKNAANDAPSATGTRATTRLKTNRAISAALSGLLYPGSPEVDRLERQRRHALDGTACAHDLRVREQRDPRRVLHHDLLQVAVDLEALVGGDRAVALHDQAVDRRVLVEHRVPPGRRPLAAGEHRARDIADFTRHRLPAEEVELVVVLRGRLAQQRQVPRPFHDLDLRVDADRRQHALDGHDGLAIEEIAALRRADRRFESFRIAGLGKELLRPRDVVAINRDGPIAPCARRDDRLRLGPVAAQDAGHETALRHCEVQRLAHALVVERLLRDVDPDVRDAVALLRQDGQVLSRLEPHGVARRHVDDDLRLAARELGDAGGTLRDRGEDELRQRGPPSAVLLEPRERDALAGHLRVEPIRARADGVLRDVLAVFREGRRAHRESLVVREMLEER